MTISGTTRVAAVIGTPIVHTLSPLLNNTVFAALGLDWVYVGLPCRDESAARAAIACARAIPFVGLNVTMPFKPLAMDLCDEVDLYARAAGGANCLTMTPGGRLTGCNTDGFGIVASLVRDGGFVPENAQVLVLGTGPTSAVGAYALARRGAKSVTFMSRSAQAAARLAFRLTSLDDWPSGCSIAVATYGAAPRIVPTVNAVVDATPLGMHDGDLPAFDPTLLHRDQVVLDVVYGHGVTAMVAGARAAGAVAFDGLAMLVEQAACTDEVWLAVNGIEADVSRASMLAATGVPRAAAPGAPGWTGA
jgi:shikimate dehydrogenase